MGLDDGQEDQRLAVVLDELVAVSGVGITTSKPMMADEAPQTCIVVGTVSFASYVGGGLAETLSCLPNFHLPCSVASWDMYVYVI